MLDYFLLRAERQFKKNVALAARSFNLISASRLKLIREAKFRSVIRHAAKNSPYYRQSFAGAPRSCRTLRDLQRLPLTDPKDVVKDSRGFVALPEREIRHVFASTGSTGEPKRIVFSAGDFERLVLSNAIGLARMGLVGGAVGQITFPYGRPNWSAGYVTQRSVERAGGLAIVAAEGLDPLEQVKIARQFRTKVLFGSGVHIERITAETREKEDLRSIGVERIFLSEEPWPERLRDLLGEAWGATVLDGYGLSEMGYGVATEFEPHGGLVVNDSDFVLEIIDPETGQPVADGELGEIVITTLSREAMPLIRYRTHDLGRILPGDGKREDPLTRIDRIKGRSDDVIIIGSGEKLYPTNFDELLSPVFGPYSFRVVLTRPSYRDVITVETEEGTGIPEEALLARVREALLRDENLRKDTEITKNIEPVRLSVLPRGSLEKGRGKRRIVEDRRNLFG